MYKDRGADIRQRKEEIKKLEDENRKMEEQLERVRKLREMQLEKEKLRLQMESLKMQEKHPNPKKQTKKPKNLRNYASNVTAENYQRAIKKVQKIKVEVSSGSQQDDKDSENLKYFLNVLGMSHYYDKLITHEIHTLPKLRQVGEKQAKQMGIPLKDMIKINKKLRTMGI